MQPRNHSVTLIRLIAALMVLSGHMSYIMGQTPPLLWGQAIQGLGVKIFFLLGGVFITKSWLLDSTPLRYGIKRFFRIWPPLAIYTILAALVFGPFLSRLTITEYYSNPSLPTYFNNLRLYIIYTLPGVFEYNPYPNAANGSLWTLPVEVLMYIAIPIFCTLLKKLNKTLPRAVVSVGLCIAICGLQICLSLIPEARFVIYATDWVSAMAVIPFYFIGMVYALFEKEFSKYLNLFWATFLLVVFTCFNFQGALYTAIFYPVFSYLILSLAFGTRINLGEKWSRHLEISYGIYLWGFFVQQSVEYILLRRGWDLPFSVELFLCSAVSVILGWLSMSLVEQPTQRLCKKILMYIPNNRKKELC